MATGYLERVRARPLYQRTAIFLAYSGVLSVILGVVVLVLTPKVAFVGYLFFASATLQLVWAAVVWARGDRT